MPHALEKDVVHLVVASTVRILQAVYVFSPFFFFFPVLVTSTIDIDANMVGML